MELIITFLAAMSGALLGASVGVYMLSPRLRPDKAELDAVRGRLQSSEFSLKSATATIDRLSKQVAEYEHNVQQSGEALQETQKQLEAQIAQRDSAEQKVAELAKEAAMKEQAAAEGDAQAKAESDRAAEELRQRLASYEAQIDAADARIRELAEKADGATTESAELQERYGREAKDRAALEEQLIHERKQAQELAGRISEMESERARLGQQLHEERQSAAKRMELLVKAQENLSQLVQAAGGTGIANGNGSNWQTLPASVNLEASAPDGHVVETDPVPAVN